MRSLQVLGSFFSLALACGCDSDLLRYALEQGVKQGATLINAKPVDKLLEKPNLISSDEKQCFERTKKIVRVLKNRGWETSGAYEKYIRLNRPWLVKVVQAAPKDSIEPYLFSYPVVGDLPYKGFYEEEDALKLEKKLKARGLDVYVRDVPAFSGLGYFADPLVSTICAFDELDLYELIAHELVHRQVYISGEADFNEALATWAAQKLLFDLDFVDKEKLRKKQIRQNDFATWVQKMQSKAKQIYALDEPLEKRRQELFKWVVKSYTSLKTYEPKEDSDLEVNNAKLSVMSSYYEWIPRIEKYYSSKYEKIEDFFNDLKKADQVPTQL